MYGFIVVQKTGRGKSTVYFIATKLLREQGKGPSIIISTSIALMRNQIQSAARLGLSVAAVNSLSTPFQRTENENKITSGQVDAIIIRPEQLANDNFVQTVLSRVLSRVSLFVLGEAHCISDSGHDSRPDYHRIVRILQAMPKNLPVLVTTATTQHLPLQDLPSFATLNAMYTEHRG